MSLKVTNSKSESEETWSTRSLHFLESEILGAQSSFKNFRASSLNLSPGGTVNFPKFTDTSLIVGVGAVAATILDLDGTSGSSSEEEIKILLEVGFLRTFYLDFKVLAIGLLGIILIGDFRNVTVFSTFFFLGSLASRVLNCLKVA